MSSSSDARSWRSGTDRERPLGWLVDEVLDEPVGLPTPGRVRGPVQDTFTCLECVPSEFVGGDLAGMGDLDDPRCAHRGRQWHLVYSGRLVDKVHWPVDVGAAVHAHGEVGQVAVVTAPDVHGPFQNDRRVVGPVGHAVSHRHGYIDPWRFAGFGHGRSAGAGRSATESLDMPPPGHRTDCSSTATLLRLTHISYGTRCLSACALGIHRDSHDIKAGSRCCRPFGHLGKQGMARK
jgi:hypothetical protein